MISRPVFASKICVTFESTIKRISQKDKVIVTGTPIRETLLNGDNQTGLSICGFKQDLPVLMVMGGSLGSQVINGFVRDNISALTKRFAIIHICGKGNLDNALINENYVQFEYVDDQ